MSMLSPFASRPPSAPGLMVLRKGRLCISKVSGGCVCVCVEGAFYNLVAMQGAEAASVLTAACQHSRNSSMVPCVHC
jgi:hypothetical protein